MWVHAEAQLDVYKSLKANGRFLRQNSRVFMLKHVQPVKPVVMIPVRLAGMMSMMMQTHSPPILGIMRSMSRG